MALLVDLVVPMLVDVLVLVSLLLGLCTYGHHHRLCGNGSDDGDIGRRRILGWSIDGELLGRSNLRLRRLLVGVLGCLRLLDWCL